MRKHVRNRTFPEGLKRCAAGCRSLPRWWRVRKGDGHSSDVRSGLKVDRAPAVRMQANSVIPGKMVFHPQESAR